MFPLDMAELLRHALPAIDGRGGGTQAYAQGGGNNPMGYLKHLRWLQTSPKTLWSMGPWFCRVDRLQATLTDGYTLIVIRLPDS